MDYGLADKRWMLSFLDAMSTFPVEVVEKNTRTWKGNYISMRYKAIEKVFANPRRSDKVYQLRRSMNFLFFMGIFKVSVKLFLLNFLSYLFANRFCSLSLLAHVLSSVCTSTLVRLLLCKTLYLLYVPKLSIFFKTPLMLTCSVHRIPCIHPQNYILVNFLIICEK